MYLDGLSHADAIIGLLEAVSKVQPAGVVAAEQRDVVHLKQEELGHGQIVEGREIQVLQLQQSQEIALFSSPLCTMSQFKL